MKNKTLILLLVIMIASFAACKHDPTPPLIDESTIPNNICFSDQVAPIILSNCAYKGCHAGNQDPDLSSYSGIMKLVKPGNPSASRLYQYAIGSQMPPSPKTPLNLQQVTLIYGWIKQGALNNVCDCDTNQFTYASTILPIIQNSCSGCHGGASPGGNVVLANYNEIVNAVQTRNLLSRISNASNPMPPSGLMSACKIEQISKWISSGTPNN